MFTFNIKKKTLNEVLKEIDDRIKELKEDRDNEFRKLEGYSKAKELYYVKSTIRNIDDIDANIHELELFRISVQYM